ncbi:CDP-glycerol glycerophosphotransferase family protein [Vibrio splendidus]|uniref:CDP-glycerol glycerophosphotransferase family protein n=1 Tax=Vibrio splendidus TaxID=29497 RepID=UPI0015E65F7E|nr:CDP-glycerol glycerophosphotransferase family protein [Vibrio splendidus]
MIISKILDIIYPLTKYLLAKVLVPLIQVVAWFTTPSKPKKKNRVALLVSSRTNTVSLSFRCLIPELECRSIEVDYHSCNYAELSFALKFRNIFYFFCRYKNADFVFLDDTFLPISFSLKYRFLSNAYIVQLWHSCGLFKRTGLDICKSNLSLFLSKANYSNYDLVSVSSEDCRRVIAGFMGINVANVKALGLSRTDSYFDYENLDRIKGHFHTNYPAAKSSKVVVYAPTYRGQAFNVESSPIPLVSDIFSQLDDDYLPFIVPHPHEVIHKNGYQLECDISSILHLVDVLVTDYSSLAMDYMIANPKGKLILFVPDIKKYNRQVGFYVDLNSITDNVIYDTQGLLTAITESSENYRFLKYKERYLNCCNGASTEQLLKHLDI